MLRATSRLIQPVILSLVLLSHMIQEMQRPAGAARFSVQAISFGSVAAMQATTQLPAFLLIVTLLLWQKIFRSLA